MRLVKSLTSAALAVTVVACGATTGGEDGEKTRAPQVDDMSAEEKAQRNEEFSDLPAGAIVRVPVDGGEPEMRMTTTTDASLDTKANALAQFEEGKTLGKDDMASEEELGSSSGQWSSYSSYKSYKSYRSYRSRNYGSSSYNYRNSFWYSRYQPKYSYRGRRYNYGSRRPYHYRTNNYRYYCYSKNRYW